MALMKYIQGDPHRFALWEGTPEVNTCWLMTLPPAVLLDPATVENITFPGSQQKE
jgi:hypothetical protein